MTPVAIAFLPLTDSAPLIAALEKGFAAEAGIELTLHKTTSWATLRDRLVYGQVQAAHMLAPLAIAVTLGLSQHPAALSAPFKLNLNGNALSMSPSSPPRSTPIRSGGSTIRSAPPMISLARSASIAASR
jgi:NitT/TauT family transport system ATP-binding protein